MNLDKAFCLVHLIKTSENNEAMRAWFYGDDGNLVDHVASVTLEELNKRLANVYGSNNAQVVVLTPNGKCAIKTVEIHKGQMKFVQQVIESILEPSLASDIQETHFEYAITGTIAQVCAVNRVELNAWRTLIGRIRGVVIGLYTIENLLAQTERLDEEAPTECFDFVYSRSKEDVVGVPSSLFSAIHSGVEVGVMDETGIVEMLKTDTPLLNLNNARRKKERGSLSKVLGSWYALPSMVLLAIFVVLEVGAVMVDQKTQAIDKELSRSYVALFPDERVVSLHKQYEYKFNALKGTRQSQAPSTVYGVFVALEKTAQSLVGGYSIETMNYMDGQYSIQWTTKNRAQLDRVKQSLTRQGLDVSLVSWQKSADGFIGNYLIQVEEKL